MYDSMIEDHDALGVPAVTSPASCIKALSHIVALLGNAVTALTAGTGYDVGTGGGSVLRCTQCAG